MKGTLLLIIAIVLLVILCPLSYVFTLIFRFKRIGRTNEDMAIIIDLFGNVCLGSLLNAVIIKSEFYYAFGKRGDTLSKAFGENQKMQSLTKFGDKIRQLIDFGFGKNHCLEATI